MHEDKIQINLLQFYLFPDYSIVSAVQVVKYMFNSEATKIEKFVSLKK